MSEKSITLVAHCGAVKMTRAQMGSLVGVSRQRVDEYVHGFGERVNAEGEEKRDDATARS